MYEDLRKYHYFVATGAYSGYFPIASGTAGTFAAMIFYYPFSFLPLWLYILFVVVLYFLGEMSADFVEFDMKEKDPSIVVIDEFIGYFVTMIFVPNTFFG